MLESAVRLITVRVEARGVLPPPVRPVLPPGTGARSMGGTAVHFANGTLDAALYARDRLGAGDRFAGPAIITQLDSTTLVPPDWSGEALSSGALLLRRG